MGFHSLDIDCIFNYIGFHRIIFSDIRLWGNITNWHTSIFRGRYKVLSVKFFIDCVNALTYSWNRFGLCGYIKKYRRTVFLTLFNLRVFIVELCRWSPPTWFIALKWNYLRPIVILSILIEVLLLCLIHLGKFELNRLDVNRTPSENGFRL